jgi:hypothetical protein
MTLAGYRGAGSERIRDGSILNVTYDPKSVRLVEVKADSAKR